jgi:hypothetical protein
MALGDFLSSLRSLGLDATQTASDLTSGPAAPELAAMRFQLCQTCPEVDSVGNPLPTQVNVPMIGILLFCGQPRWAGLGRDAVADGCGCCLQAKCKCAGAQCPRGRW